MRRGGARARRLGVMAGLLVAALVLAGCSDLPQARPDWPSQVAGSFSPQVTKQLRDSVDDAMKLAGAPGAVVGVWAPWAGSWSTGIGQVSQAKGAAPMTTSAHFRVGQITTSMTCSVLLQLAQEGKVSLGGTVDDYLPQMTGVGTLTLRQLCQNTSGLGDYTAELEPQFVDNPTRPWVPLELVTDGLGASAPGSASGFLQSNAGMILLGMTLQSASGQSWQQLYDRYIFQRLGMTSSSLPSGNTLPAPYAHGYATSLNADGSPQCGVVNDVSVQSPSLSWTAGGVVSSLADLKQYAQALAAGSLLSGSSAKAQWKTVSMGAGTPSWQGYGLGVETFGPLRGQVGDVPGYLTAILSDPSSGLTVAVMLNNSSAGPSLIQNLALKLAAIAAKAPARKGTAPSVTIPWTTDQTDAAMAAAAVCKDH